MADLIRASESDNPYKESPISFIEMTYRDSYMYPDSFANPWNPDDLVKKDQSYTLYEDMLKDDQVSVCLQIKKDLVLSSGYDFISEEDGQEDMVKDLKIALSEDPDYSFEEMLEEILSAYEFGFSISEKIFKLRNDGRLSLKALRTRYPGSWLLHTDPQGNVTKYEQLVAKETTEVPPHVLLHYINKRKFQNPYGTSDLRPAYQAWFAKKHITRWYSIFIEKAAGPIPVGKYDKNAIQDQTEITNLYNALKKFQTKTSLVIPKYLEVEFLETTSTGEAYIKGINIFNMFIGRSLLIPDLLGFQGSETSGGSYALGKTQMEIFFEHIRRRRKILERIINQEIIWPIILYNYGYVDNYPKFKFQDVSKEDIQESIKIWADVVKARVYSPSSEEIDHFKNLVNFPITDSIEEPMEPQDPNEPQDNLNPDGMPPDITIMPTMDGGSTYASGGKYPPASGNFGNKTNFDLIGKALDTQLESFIAISNGLIDDVFKKLYVEIDKKSIIQKKKVDKLDALSLKNLGTIRQKLYRSLLDLYKKSKELASSEIFKSSFAQPIVSEEFLKILEEETYQYIGDWEYNVTKGARLAIIQAIKDGKSISEVIDILEKDTKNKALSSVETYARTKFTEVMNKGRIAFFDDTKVVSGYQYSAVLDDRTTEICRGLHGKTFKAGEQPIPPMHFNCRSVLIPITIYEDFTPDTKVGKTPIEQFIEEKKGVGFPKQ